MANIHISISAEPIFNLGPVTITNSMLVAWLVTGILCAFAIYASKRIKHTSSPSGLQNFLEAIIEVLYGMVAGVMGERKSKQVFKYIATFFLFILLGNWVGLLPGVGSIGFTKVHSEEVSAVEEHTESTESSPEKKAATEFVPLFRGATADINVTLGLALASVFLIQYVGIKNLGPGYFGKFFVSPFKNLIGTFIGILELVAEFAKILSFAFRLFGNIFAGEVLLTVIAFLVPILAPLPFLGLELFVGIVQALVFSMLTLVFMQIATISHDEEHH